MTLLFAGTALLPEGWAKDVTVRIGASGRIEAVSTGPAPEGAERVPVLLPALSNLHSHTFQRAMAGLSETRGPDGNDSFWTWREIMYRFLDLLSPEDVEAIAALAFMEMQEEGFAAVAEFHYLHHRPGGAPYAARAELSARIAAAAAQTGIGLTLLPVYYAQGGVDGRPLAGGQLRFGNDLDGFLALAEEAGKALAALPEDTACGLAPHSLRAVGAADLARLAAMREGRPFHMHIAEQTREVEEVVAAYGARPVEWLLDTIGPDAGWCLVHATHMTPVETRRLAASGAVAGLCPVTEASLGDGIFDMPGFRQTGGRFGVGTDSNIRISAAEELRQLEYGQRLRDRRRVVVAEGGRSNGRTLYDGTLAGGARALGRDSGAIAAGRWADLVALDPEAAGFPGFEGDRILDAWLFSGGATLITDLWSAGRRSVRNGRHVAREPIAARYRTALAAIMERL